MFSNHTGIKLEIDNRNIIIKFESTQKLNNILLYNPWEKGNSEGFEREFLNNHNWWDYNKQVLKRKCMASNAYITKESSQTNSLSLHLIKFEKVEQNQPKSCRKQPQ